MLDSIEYYADDDAVLRSPGLQPVVVKAKPSPTPPPIVTQLFLPPPRVPSVSSPSSRRRKKSNRRKTRPTQGDWVLIREMDPNRPDIAQQVSEQALNSDSGSEDEEEMDDVSPTATNLPSRTSNAQSVPVGIQSVCLQRTAQASLGSANGSKGPAAHRDSVLEDDVIRPKDLVADRRASQPSTVNILPNGIRLKPNSVSLTTPTSSTLSATSVSPPNQQRGAVTNGQSYETSFATTPNLRQITIPPSRGLPTDKLPAIQAPSPARDGTAGSPDHQPQLPSFRHVDDIARSALSDQEANRANGFLHRQSISSVSQSPTSIVRQLSISSHSPVTPFPPLSASSPISASSEPHRPDIFLRTSGGGVFGVNARRPSQAVSDSGPYPATLHSASTSESYQSSEGLSPGTQQTPIEGRPRHMSLDGALASRILPPPVGSGIQQIPSHSSAMFKCDYPNCNAAPFQTQYLLNSHTNVHSQNRPHYCPVKDCPRGEGGKGFKRKNEMIRHGLVHQSPGYVCPFCPDREHKYPRPDNLQRHVRVHHVDKDKDDPQLRDVLAQRPEGGSRGRRRRVSEAGR